MMDKETQGKMARHYVYYRFPPKDKPPLLSDEQFNDASDWYEGTSDCLKCRKLIAQAQREADIKWYEGR